MVVNQYRTMHRQPNPILRQFFSDLIRAAKVAGCMRAIMERVAL